MNLCFLFLALWASQDKWMGSVIPVSTIFRRRPLLDAYQQMAQIAESLSQQIFQTSGLADQISPGAQLLGSQASVPISLRNELTGYKDGSIRKASSLEHSMAKLNRELRRTEAIFRQGVDILDSLDA